MTRVLLVEDNAADARLVHEMLKEKNPRRFHVLRAETLGEALRRLAHGSYDVVLGREDAEQLVRSIRYSIARERRTGRAGMPDRPSRHADRQRA